MFSRLSNNLSAALGKIRHRGHLSEDDVNNTMREVRIALLEADVSLQVVKSFIARIKDRTCNVELSKSITPGQMIIKMVHDELVEILGGQEGEQDSKISRLHIHGRQPAVIMLVGLQGTGKTTTAAKLALWLRDRHKKNVLLASADVYRPAAQLQLAKLGEQIKVESLPIISGQNPEEIGARAMIAAKSGGHDILIMDTAGRLQTDNALMAELAALKAILSPTEMILVTDVMMGQESANVAQVFNIQLGLSSIILAKTDSDSRGGVALSMKMITGCPIKFIGTGEGVSAFEQFHPERTASQILGMGDVLSLVEKTKEAVSEEEAAVAMSKMKSGQFDMNDLLKQIRNIRKIGSIGSILSMIPGMGKIREAIGDRELNEDSVTVFEAIINSMTKKERRNPSILNGSRKKRIAKGSGRTVEDVNRLVKRFNGMRMTMKQMANCASSGKRINTDIFRNLMK